MDGAVSIEQEGQSENIVSQKSISGKDLPIAWPQILNPDEEAEAYNAMYDESDDRTQPPTHAQVERLSYELTSGDKRLRFFAVYHQRDMNGLNDPNLTQYEVIERKFLESPPQLVLFEGIVDDVNYPLTRERAISLGEPAWMCYLVQQHNARLREGEKPIVIESGDTPVNNNPNNQVRDQYIVKNAAERFQDYDKVDIVFGSGHAIRERKAWEQFFDREAA